MKFYRNLIAAMAAILMVCLCETHALAQITTPPQPYPAYSTVSTNAGTLSYVVIGCNNTLGSKGTPVVTFISATSDKAASAITGYRVDAVAACNDTNTTVTIPINTTNGIGTSGTIVIRHLVNDWYEKRTLTTATGSTNCVVTAAPLQTCAIGDIVYHVVAGPSIQWNATTNTLSGSALMSGQPGCPLLMDLDGTTTAKLNGVTAVFTQ